MLLPAVKFFLLLCIQQSIANVIDGPKCLVFEEVTPEVIVNVKTILFNNDLPDITEVEYGEHIKLICDVDLPIKKWRARKMVLTDGVSDDFNELDIISVNMSYHGQYITCESKPLHSKHLKEIYGTHIIINNLAPPMISDLTPTKVTVMENDNATIPCKIVGGVPPPTLHWQFNKPESTEAARKLTDVAEELTFENASFEEVGHYQCIAENAVDRAVKNIELVVEKFPTATIEDGTDLTFPYGNRTKFTCKVEGYPLPKVVWTDKNNKILDSIDVNINSHEKLSFLKMKILKKSNDYTCSATNSLGSAEATINVTVLSPFVIHNYPNDKINLHYNASTSIICNITSTFPMTLKWYGPNPKSTELIEIHTDAKYKISMNELFIKSMQLDMVGKHKCVASLISDVDEMKMYTTDVQIDNLAIPSLSDSSTIIVNEDSSITLYCKVFGGVPPPTINWQEMKHGKNEYSDMHISDKMLDIQNITIADAGKYRCEVKNALGNITKVTDVLVRKAPVTTINGVKNLSVSVEYGSDYTYVCDVIAYPMPTDWDYTEKNVIFKDIISHEHQKQLNVTMIKVIRNKVLYCRANNFLGSDHSLINVTVLSPFTVYQTPLATTYVNYKAPTSLVCNITSSFPMRIRWYHNSTEVHTSDKHTISTNETVLHILSADLEVVGQYRCDVSLIDDDEPKEAFTSDVLIDNLRSPVITYFNGTTVTVKAYGNLSLYCKAKGNPTPLITWTVKYTSSGNTQLIGNGESIASNNIGIEHSGTYICTAANIVGIDSQSTQVTVNP